MTDIPRDVLLAAGQTVIMFPAFKSVDGTSRVIELVALAILAERERCSAHATAELRNTYMLMSNPPQSSAAWDIRNAIDAGTPAP